MSFILGISIGTIIGVVAMCLLEINDEEDPQPTKAIDLLNKIANGKIEDGTIFYVNGDFFYNLIVIDEELYVINTMTKQLELLGSKYIGGFIRDDVKLLKLNNEVEIIEEDPTKISPEELAENINSISYLKSNVETAVNSFNKFSKLLNEKRYEKKDN